MDTLGKWILVNRSQWTGTIAIHLSRFDYYCSVNVCVLQISYVLLQFDYFVCPIDYDEVKGALSMECERSFAFRLHDYSVPWFIHSIGALVCSCVFNSCCL